MTIDMSYDNHNSYEEYNFFYLTFSSQTYLLLFTFGANGDQVIVNSGYSINVTLLRTFLLSLFLIACHASFSLDILRLM